jgi:hypothetical protein
MKEESKERRKERREEGRERKNRTRKGCTLSMP